MNPAQLVAWLRALAWVAIACVVIWGLTRINLTLAVFGFAAVISYMLYPCVNWLFTQSTALLGRQLSWGISVVIVYVTLPVLLGGVLWVILPAVSSQVETIKQNLPAQVERLQEAAGYWQHRFEHARIPADLQKRLQELADQGIARISESVGNLVANVANGLLAAFTWMLFVVVSLIISQFMLLNLPEMRENFYEAVPERFREEVRQLMHEVNFVFGGFIKGTCILSILASLVVYALMSGLGLLSWVGVPGIVAFEYSLVFALLTLVLYPIPILGLAAIAVIGALAGWFQTGSSPTYVVLVVFLLVGGITAVDRVVGPRIMSKAMGVSPLFVMFAAFAGAELMGFWGMILGVPMAAALKVLFRYVRARFLVPQAGDISMAGIIRLESHPRAMLEADDLRCSDHVHNTVEATGVALHESHAIAADATRT